MKLAENFVYLATLGGLGIGARALVFPRAADPCAAIGGQKWVSPKAVRDCYNSIPVNETLKDNIIEVVSKTLAFHTSVNYQIQAPEPFAKDVHEDLFADLARISGTKYDRDLDFHIDMSRTLKRLNDGHCVYINSCYDSFFLNYLPIPLVQLTDSSGKQSVHIAPEAFQVASAEFPDQIDFWQNALPGKFKGQLESLSGAKVLTINGKDPNVAVDANAQITGSFQAVGTRQNSFFSSYMAGASWTYLMGNFAQQSLPLDDEVVLEVQLNGASSTNTITLPYRSRFHGSQNQNFVDVDSFLSGHCFANEGTNGIDLNAPNVAALSDAQKPVGRFQQVRPLPMETPKQSVDIMLDTSPVSDVVLPPGLTPQTPVNGSRNAAQFFLLDDKKTGVLALGSFSDNSLDALSNSLLTGLLNLKSLGATQLVVDVSNNGGGFICAAEWLHRIIVGPKSTSVPQAGLNTTARAGPLAQQIVQQIVTKDLDPFGQLLYNPLQWRDANDDFFAADVNWLVPPVNKVINGHEDAFSQQLGQECQPEGFPTKPPKEALFDPKKVVIVNNGRCASSCSLFSITMSKEEGAKTVVLGGRSDVQQQYCGTVGGQSTDFSTIDTEIKTTQLKDSPLAPPDFLVNGVQGITWRLGFGIEDPTQPEEWQDHPADLNLPLTAEIVNNPRAIWETVAARLL